MTDFKEINKEHKVILLPNYTKLTEQTVEHFDHFIEAVSPGELRENLLEIYHMYIIKEYDALPTNFNDMANDMFILFDFLKKLDDQLNDKNNELVNERRT